MTREEALTWLRGLCATYGLWDGRCFTVHMPMKALKFNELSGEFEVETGANGIDLKMPILKLEELK